MSIFLSKIKNIFQNPRVFLLDILFPIFCKSSYFGTPKLKYNKDKLQNYIFSEFKIGILCIR